MPIEDCKTIGLRKIEEYRGNLTPIESNIDIPFDIKRIYYLYDVPGRAVRAAHAHKNLHQLFIAISGSFDIALDDGVNKSNIHLNNPDTGFYMPPMIWREINGFSSGSVCLVLASEHYDESDYYRDYEEFISEVKERNTVLQP